MIRNVQYLRAMAAMIVILFHAQFVFNEMSEIQIEYFDFGAGGVDIFFVISGLIMWLTTCENRHGPARFIRNRVVRIVPLYWFFTTIKLGLVAVLPVLTASRLDPMHIAGSYAFLPMVNPASGVRVPLIVAGWTLNLEMFFYGLFALALHLPNHLRAWAICLALAGTAFAGFFVSANSFAGFYASPIVLEFGAGVALGAYLVPHLSRMGIGAPGWGVLALAGFVLLAVLPDPGSNSWMRLAVWGVPGFFLVSGALLQERTSRPIRLPGMLMLGNASYALYLVHPLSVALAGIVWRRAQGPIGTTASGLLFILVAFAASLVAGVVAHFTIERPLARWFATPKRQALPSVT